MATVTSNENFKVLYRKSFGDLSAASYFLCAGLAGAVSALITTPLDNIRTRLNTQVFHQENRMMIQEAVKRFVPTGNNRRQARVHVQKAYSQHNTALGSYCECDPLSPQNKSLGSAQLKYPNAVCAVRIILKEEGKRGFFKGAFPRIFNQSMSSGVSWMCYETIKDRLLKVEALK